MKTASLFSGLFFLVGVAVAQESDSSVDSLNKLDLGGATANEVNLDPNNSAGAIKGKFGNLNLPDAVEAPKPSQRKIELPESVKRLSPAQQNEIQNLLSEAAGFIQGIRLTEGMDRLIQIEAITKDLFQTQNLKGAIYTKLRDFKKARECFQASLKLQPDLMEAMFNLAELDFVEKRFPEAEAGFQKLKDQFQGKINPKTKQPYLVEETLKLIDYKLFISMLRQSPSKEKPALDALAKFSPYDDYPLYYYSNAALNFQRGKTEEAQGWLSSAENIYSKPVQSIYIDALIEMGWLDSL